MSEDNDDWNDLDPTQNVADLQIFSTGFVSPPAIVKSELEGNSSRLECAASSRQESSWTTVTTPSPLPSDSAPETPLGHDEGEGWSLTLRQKASKRRLKVVEEPTDKLKTLRTDTSEAAEAPRKMTKMESLRAGAKSLAQGRQDADESGGFKPQSNLPEERPANLRRKIGTQVATADIDRVYFLQCTTFARCETVAVARSSDHFDYGQVLADDGKTVTILICESPALKKQLPYLLVGKLFEDNDEAEITNEKKMLDILNSSEAIYAFLRNEDTDCHHPGGKFALTSTLLNIAQFILMFNTRRLFKLGSQKKGISSLPEDFRAFTEFSRREEIPSREGCEELPELPAKDSFLASAIKRQEDLWCLQLEAIKQQMTSQTCMWDAVMNSLKLK